MVLGVLDLDYALRENKPNVPVAGGDDFNARQTQYLIDLDKWDKSNRMANTIIKQSISVGIRGAIPDKKNNVELTAKEFFDSIEENFKGSSKTYAITLIMKMLISRYNG